MSQYPPPPVQPPVEYAAPQIPIPPSRPTSVTVLAIIGIVFGALGVLCTPFGLLPYFVDFGQPNPVVDGIKANKLAFFWTMGSSILGILLAVILLAGSIGSLKLAAWARSVMLAYGAMAIVLTLAGAVINFTTIMPIMNESFKDMPGGGGFAAMGGMIGAVVGTLLFLIYPICVLIFFNSERVKHAFANPPPAAI
jgi:hypothetical protein